MQKIASVAFACSKLAGLSSLVLLTTASLFADDKNATTVCRRAIITPLDFDHDIADLALENGEQELDRVRIHFVTARHDQGISLQVLRDYARAMESLPNLKLDVVVSNDIDESDHYHSHLDSGPLDVEAERRQRDQQIERLLSLQTPQIRQRIRILPTDLDLDYWAQDRSKPLSNGAALISASKDKARFSQFLAERLYSEVQRVFVDLEGGNLVVGRKHIFSLSTLLAINQIDRGGFDRFFGKNLFFVDFGKWSAPHFDVNFHSDLLIAVAYRPQLDKEVVFLSSPLAASRAIQATPHPSAEAQKIMADLDRYAGFFAKWDDHNRRLEAHLIQSGYDVRLIPGVSLPRLIEGPFGTVSAPIKSPLRYYNYVNAIFSGDHVLMPWMQVPELDSAAEKTYQDAGLQVIQMPSSRALLQKKGAIRCASYTSRRICELK